MMSAVRPALIGVQQAGEVAEVAQLARIIWPEHYPAIISHAQIEYMLARFQSEAAIAAQIAAGDEYFLLHHHGRNVGYAAIRTQLAEQRLFVSKLYIVREMRNQGIGRFTLAYLQALAQHRNLKTVWLVVNKHNPAVLAYLRWGFVKVAEVVTDIGDGYVMDDFRLELALTQEATVER